MMKIYLKVGFTFLFFSNWSFAVHPEWTYSGATGPLAWGALATKNVACSQGKKQSPIHIQTQPNEKNSYARIKYRGLEVFPKDVQAHSVKGVQVFFSSGNEFRLNETLYSLKEVQFHSPSEHRWQERLFPLEAQFYHESKTGKKLAVAVFLDEASESLELDGGVQVASKILDSLLLTAQKKNYEPIKFNPVLLMPHLGSFYQYEGSLTQPPCTEGVDWIVFEKTMPVLAKTLEAWKTFSPGNARPVQLLHQRKIRFVKQN